MCDVFPVFFILFLFCFFIFTQRIMAVQDRLCLSSSMTGTKFMHNVKDSYGYANYVGHAKDKTLDKKHLFHFEA